MSERATEGGSYIRGKDGKLRRVEYTRPAGTQALPAPPPPPEQKAVPGPDVAKLKGKEKS